VGFRTFFVSETILYLFRSCSRDSHLTRLRSELSRPSFRSPLSDRTQRTLTFGLPCSSFNAPFFCLKFRDEPFGDILSVL